MNKIKKLKKKTTDFLYDHLVLKEILSNAVSLFYASLSAVIFAFGFSCFVSPYGSGEIPIVTGGVSGVSQDIYLIISFFDSNVTLSDVTSIGYFVLNIPILIFSFFCVGKKFTIYTLVNVGLTSILVKVFPSTFAYKIQELLVSGGSYGGIIARTFFSGVTVGIASAIAFKGGVSSGGIDVFSYYFSNKKSTNVGKYAVMINSFVIGFYTIFSIVKKPNEWNVAVLQALFAFVYLLIVAMVIDLINVRNKKEKLEIITSFENLSDVLISNFPHSATLMKGKGAYKKNDKYLIIMIVSSFESKKVAELARKVDDSCFITITQLNQVYGRFYIKPVE